MNQDWINSHQIRVEPQSSRARLDEVVAGQLTLLNSTKPFDVNAPDTLPFENHVDRLWQVRFHTHEWLLELISGPGNLDAPEAELVVSTLEGWWRAFSRDDTAAHGLAWNSYVVATRIRSWCLVYQSLSEEFRHRIESELASQLIRHGEFLQGNIEWDLRANHLLRDAIGLGFVSRFVNHELANDWHRLASELAISQWKEQVLPDGGHFERSPMYHAEALADFVDLGQLLDQVPSLKEEFDSTIAEMREVLHWSCHPDRRICLFNDAAFNGMPSAEWLLGDHESQSNPPLPRGDRLFRDFGLLAVHEPDWSIFFDVGRVGVDYQPGHAHADTLSVEASCQGMRIFVDPGTYAYDLDARRSYDRATPSHNTVSIDGEDSSEVWDIFRVGRRAFPNIIEYLSDNKCVICEATHDGYRHLPGRVQHDRRVEYNRHSEWSILDRIHGSGKHRVAGGLLVAPGWQVNQDSDHTWILVQHGTIVRVQVENKNTTCTVDSAEYHPEYGMTHTTRRLSWCIEGSVPCEIRIRITAENAN